MSTATKFAALLALLALAASPTVVVDALPLSDQLRARFTDAGAQFDAAKRWLMGGGAPAQRTVQPQRTRREAVDDTAPVAEDAEIVFVQSVWRHGDRSPLHAVKTDKYQEDDWPQGFGELSTKGMEQHYKLGRKLRQRYVTDLKLIQPTYHSREIYVRSTDWNRTVTSAISNFIGFYAPDETHKKHKTGGGGGDSDGGPPSVKGWPQPFVPIPVHTLPRSEETLGNIGSDLYPCARLKKLNQLTQQTPEYLKLADENKEFFKNLTELCGEDIDITTIDRLKDALFVEKIYDRLPAWCDDQIYDRVQKIGQKLRSFEFGMELEPFHSVDFEAQMTPMVGGPLLSQFIDHMQAKAACDAKLGNHVTNESISEECQWLNKLKYYAFSGHDDTVSAVSVALGTNATRFTENATPYYSTALTVELWRTVNDTYNVKLLLWDPSKTGFDVVTGLVEGCGGGASCPLERFAARSEHTRPTPTMSELCANVDIGEVIPPDAPESGSGGGGDTASHAAGLVSTLPALVAGIFALLTVSSARLFTFRL